MCRIMGATVGFVGRKEEWMERKEGRKSTGEVSIRAVLLTDVGSGLYLTITDEFMRARQLMPISFRQNHGLT